jgi:hypothetical protein
VYNGQRQVWGQAILVPKDPCPCWNVKLKLLLECVSEDPVLDVKPPGDITYIFLLTSNASFSWFMRPMKLLISPLPSWCAQHWRRSPLYILCVPNWVYHRRWARKEVQRLSGPPSTIQEAGKGTTLSPSLFYDYLVVAD